MRVATAGGHGKIAVLAEVLTGSIAIGSTIEVAAGDAPIREALAAL